MGSESKKPFYKKWWVWVIVIIIIAAIGTSGGEEKEPNQAGEGKTEVTDEGKETKEENKKESIPREYNSALKKAEQYSETMHMSKAAIYDQLVSEYGEQFPAEAAQYAIDNLKADYKANALEKAKDYAETMDMSTSAIYDQLVSEHGEQFTPEEAQYAIDHLDK